MDSRKMIAILVVCLGAIVAIHARSLEVRSSSDDSFNSNSMSFSEEEDSSEEEASSESMSTEMLKSMCSGPMSPESSPDEGCNPAVTTQASSAAQETVAVAATNAEVVELTTGTIMQESAAQETVVGPTNDEVSDATIAVTSDDKDGRR